MIHNEDLNSTYTQTALSHDCRVLLGLANYLSLISVAANPHILRMAHMQRWARACRKRSRIKGHFGSIKLQDSDLQHGLDLAAEQRETQQPHKREGTQNQIETRHCRACG